MADVPEAAAESPAPESSPTPEQTTTETASEPTESVSDQPETGGSESEEVVQSERGQKRIQELANRANEAKDIQEENKKLRELLGPEEQTQAVSQQQHNLPPWRQQASNSDIFEDLGSEVTPEQYQKHVEALAERKADSIAQLRVAQYAKNQERQQNLEQDLSHLEKEYPELAGEISDKRLANSLSRAKQAYQQVLRANPDARLRDFIEPIMEARTGGVENGRESASASLAKQQQQAAVTPSTQSAEHVSSEEQLMEMMKKGEITAKEAEKKFADLLN